MLDNMIYDQLDDAFVFVVFVLLADVADSAGASR